MPSTASPDYLARLMVRVASEQRENCRKALAARGIATRLPYRLPSALDGTAFPQATRSAAELLELPLPARWSANDVALVASSIAPFCVATPAHQNTLSGALA